MHLSYFLGLFLMMGGFSMTQGKIVNLQGSLRKLEETGGTQAPIGNFTAKMVGSAPKFKLMLEGSNDHVMFGIDSVYELDSAGKTQALVDSIASLGAEGKTLSHFKAGEEGGCTLNSIDVDCVRFELTVDGTKEKSGKAHVCDSNKSQLPAPADPAKKIVVSLTLYLINEEITLPAPIGTIPAGSLKFDVGAKNWNFCGTESDLVFTFSISDPSAFELENDDDHAKFQFVLDGKNTTIDMPKEDAAGNAAKITSEKQGSALDITLSLKQSDDIIYDPVIVYDPQSPEDPTQAPEKKDPISGAMAKFLSLPAMFTLAVSCLFVAMQ